MPHKRNPIVSENVTGLSRLLRGYAVAALEDVALWHERDISHSSVERVIFPDAFILAHYAAHRLANVVSGLVVNEKQIQKNLELTQGQIHSAQLLLELVKAGMSREDAYAVVQRHSHGLKDGETLRDALVADKALKKILGPKEIDRVFKGDGYRKFVAKRVEESLK